jgi:hypothetical protein
MWMSFAAKESKVINKDDFANQKEKYEHLAFLWKNRMCQIATVSITYIQDLHDKIQNQNKRIMILEQELKATRELLKYFESVTI